MTTTTTAIWWIRRDLRLHDNPALAAALEAANEVIPLFIVSPTLTYSAYVGEKRRAWLNANLERLDADLRTRGSRLIVRHGKALPVLRKLVASTNATIFAQADTSPYGRKRDALVAAELPLTLTEGLTIRPVDAVFKKDGNPYTVFTPYSRTWKGLPLPRRQQLIPAPANIVTPELNSLPLAAVPPLPDTVPFAPGHAAAVNRLEAFANRAINAYDDERNRMDLDGTSGLSPYLRFGILSPRECAVAAINARSQAQSDSARQGADTWLSELIWRDFYHAILYHFPHVRARSFRDNMVNIRWRNNETEFAAWKAGKTGFPVVDAAMRQLNATGWMHNRARMIVASFLVKDLLINWQWGERYFMQQLLDGDPAANNGGWQWSAGTGTDAAPYFRIFNPISQGKKFDPDGAYVRRWVPELARVEKKFIHEPSKLGPLEQRTLGMGSYPPPIVDHKMARQRTLDAYKAARDAG